MMHFVFHTNWFIPKRFKATTYGPLVFIRPAVRGDVGLLAHELTHVQQFWRNPFLYGFQYWLSKKRRFAFEVEAYRAQLKHYPERTDRIAEILATKYKLDITKEQALAALKGAT